MINTTILLIGIFVFVLMFFLVEVVENYTFLKIKRRIFKKKLAHKNKSRNEKIIKITTDNFNKYLTKILSASAPKDGWQDSEKRQKFIHAGLRDEHYFRLFYFFKVALALFVPLILALLIALLTSYQNLLDSMSYLYILAIICYFIPDYLLNRMIRIRLEAVDSAVPNFLDLLLVCAESGMSLDAGLMRVSKEFSKSSPILSEEIHLTLLEIRAGADRLTAFKNLGLRVNSLYMSSVISIFNQVDQFGTSLGDSLRIHSDIIRTQRIQRAESLAAKLPVKMLFPLIFCLFPVVIIVLIGPSAISVGSALVN
jgi:tight adherence protein C